MRRPATWRAPPPDIATQTAQDAATIAIGALVRLMIRRVRSDRSIRRPCYTSHPARARGDLA
jgi:hypothetical protein